ncbi:MAG: DNA repair protein RecO [Candidatus Eremiobacteraeota bacterium]|nr:DNA repair protein RecO [Candidatus Eremiobacteraeota bacterium]MBV8221995.1 DNA repair protein RecO [Candidatus Eremiobacteraeota bacterium]
MKSYNVDAFVLRLRPLGEADRILTLFSRERGKLHAVAKGSRRSGSRFGARLDFFNRVSLTLHRGRSLDIITGAQSAIDRSVWDRLVEPETFALASYVAEVIDALSEPDLAVPELFDMLCELRDAIGAGVPAASLAPAIDLRLLGVLGLAPELDACARCGSALGNRPLAGGRARLSPNSGGLVCRRCNVEDVGALTGDGGATFGVSAAELSMLRALRTAPFTALGDIGDAARLRRLTSAFVEYQLGRRSKALAVANARTARRPAPKAAAR